MEMPSRNIRTLMVDDSPEFIQAAERFLCLDQRIEIVGQINRGSDALDQIISLQPDLVLLDFAMPDLNGLEVTRQIKGLPKPPFVIILTLHANPEYQARAMTVGSDGFIPKADFGTDLLPMIHELFGAPKSECATV